MQQITQPIYTASIESTGGRNGSIKSLDNNALELEVRMPKALGGGSDDYTNPEQLFAAGYAACFDGALSLVKNEAKIKTGNTTIKADVTIGKTEEGAFGLAVTLEVNIPGVDIEQAKKLVEKAHAVCPYSHATRGNINVELIATNN